MAKLNIWLEMIGREPASWYETPTHYDGNVLVIGTSQTRSVDAGNGLFRQQLAERLWKLFDVTIKTRRAGHIDTVNASSVADRSAIAGIDLLCYVCETRMQSVIRNAQRAAFDQALAQHPRMAGLTNFMVVNNAYMGIASEIYMDQLMSNLTAATYAVYHEWMHNKTNWAQNENTNWVHTRGGGGLALDDGGGNLRGLTALNAQIMAARLPLANRQFVDAIPMR